MMRVTFGDMFTRDVVEIVLNGLGYEVDDALYLLTRCEVWVFADADEFNNGLGKDDLADVDIDMLAFQDFYLVNPPLNSHVLEDVYCQVYYMLIGGIAIALRLAQH